MKPEKKEKIGRGLLSLFCFTAYISLFSAIIANAFGTDLYHFIGG